MKNIYDKFGRYYNLIYDSFYDYDKECDNLEDLFTKFLKGHPGNILDVGCGTGSHAMELARRGYHVTGIDISSVMIKEAKKKAKEASLECEFFVMDMRELDIDKEYDCAICMFGSFDYLTTKRDLGRFLRRLSKVLSEDSIFVFEFWNFNAAQPEFKSWLKVKDENMNLIRLAESKLNERTKINTLNMEFFIFNVDENVESFTETHRLRCYTVSEIKSLFLDYGFKIIATYNKDMKTNALKGGPLNTFNLVAVAKKSKKK
jgi:ubiquinone/menaquinone biosynthesis C-methylase UbiE